MSSHSDLKERPVSSQDSAAHNNPLLHQVWKRKVKRWWHCLDKHWVGYHLCVSLCLGLIDVLITVLLCNRFFLIWNCQLFTHFILSCHQVARCLSCWKCSTNSLFLSFHCELDTQVQSTHKTFQIIWRCSIKPNLVAKGSASAVQKLHRDDPSVMTVTHTMLWLSWSTTTQGLASDDRAVSILSWHTCTWTNDSNMSLLNFAAGHISYQNFFLSTSQGNTLVPETRTKPEHTHTYTHTHSLWCQHK